MPCLEWLFILKKTEGGQISRALIIKSSVSSDKMPEQISIKTS
jgi:hypothetical protein